MTDYERALKEHLEYALKKDKVNTMAVEMRIWQDKRDSLYKQLAELDVSELAMHNMEADRDQLLKKLAELDSVFSEFWKTFARLSEALEERMKSLPDLQAIEERIRRANERGKHDKWMRIFKRKA